jgi:hypothetical protein
LAVAKRISFTHGPMQAPTSTPIDMLSDRVRVHSCAPKAWRSRWPGHRSAAQPRLAMANPSPAASNEMLAALKVGLTEAVLGGGELVLECAWVWLCDGGVVGTVTLLTEDGGCSGPAVGLSVTVLIPTAAAEAASTRLAAAAAGITQRRARRRGATSVCRLARARSASGAPSGARSACSARIRRRSFSDVTGGHLPSPTGRRA